MSYFSALFLIIGVVKDFITWKEWSLSIVASLFFTIQFFFFGRWLKIDFYRNENGDKKAAVVEGAKLIEELDAGIENIVIRPIKDPLSKVADIVYQVVLLFDAVPVNLRSFAKIRQQEVLVIRSYVKKREAILFTHNILSYLYQDVMVCPKVLPEMTFSKKLSK